MPDVTIAPVGALNLYINPLTNSESELIRAVNVTSIPYGAKSKRRGYSTYLGTANGSAVTSLFTWTKDDGTTIFNYRASGNRLYYSEQGTSEWAICGNGTIPSGARVSHAVLDNTLIISTESASTRHTTNGTSFTDTPLAPIATDLAQYQNRIYAAGTASDLFYSTTNDATNWSTVGTSDSSSFKIPGAGKLNRIFKAYDNLVACKNSGLLYKWDGYYLVDTGTKLAPSSPKSVAEQEGFFFGLNRLGYFGGYGAAKPQLLSNAIERQIYNSKETGIEGTEFNIAPGVTHRYDYLCSVGDVSDDLTDEKISNCIHKYNFQKNEWLNWSFAHKPTAFNSYTDNVGKQQLIFGDSSGQCYKMDTSNTDDNQPIEAVMEFVVHGGIPHLDKEWMRFYAFFNPGNQCKVQVAMANTFTKQRKRYYDLGDCSDGVAEFRFPSGSRSKLLFIKIYERSTEQPFTFYGFTYNAKGLAKE